MKEILELIFSSLWTFIGTVILLGLIGDGIANIVRAFRRK